MPASPLLLVGGAAPVLVLVLVLAVALIVVVPSPEAPQAGKRREAIDILADIGLTPMAVACLPSGVARLMVLDLVEGGGNEDRLQEEEDSEEKGRLMLGVRRDDDVSCTAVMAHSCIDLTRAALKLKVLVVRGETGRPVVGWMVPAALALLL
jgi:hypothetical protein